MLKKSFPVLLAMTSLLPVYGHAGDAPSKFEVRVDRSTEIFSDMALRASKLSGDDLSDSASNAQSSDARSNGANSSNASSDDTDDSSGSSKLSSFFSEVKTVDAGIPLYLLQSAKCVLVIPSAKSGSLGALTLGFGAKYGAGVASCQNADKSWSLPSFTKIEGGNWGSQIGIESTDLVMLFMTADAPAMLESKGFHIGAEVSVAAGPFGRDLSGSTDLHFQEGVLSYSRSKGLYIGAVFTGAMIKPDDVANQEIYGKDKNFTPAHLLSGQMDKSAVPASASKFSQVLNALSQGDDGSDDQSDPAQSAPAQSSQSSQSGSASQSGQMNQLAPIGQQFPAISPDPSDAPAESGK